MWQRTATTLPNTTRENSSSRVEQVLVRYYPTPVTSTNLRPNSITNNNYTKALRSSPPWSTALSRNVSRQERARWASSTRFCTGMRGHWTISRMGQTRAAGRKDSTLLQGIIILFFIYHLALIHEQYANSRWKKDGIPSVVSERPTSRSCWTCSWTCRNGGFHRVRRKESEARLIAD